jgi:hypothetical protein
VDGNHIILYGMGHLSAQKCNLHLWKQELEKIVKDCNERS